MSWWKGHVSRNRIDLVRVGGGSWLPVLFVILVPLLLAGAVIKTIQAGLVHKPLVGIALTVLVLSVLILLTMYVGAFLRRPGFSYRMVRRQQVVAAEPLRLASERVRELEAPAPRVAAVRAAADRLEA